MDTTVALLLASFVAAGIGPFSFINSMSRGLFGNAQLGARVIVAPNEMNRVEDPSATAADQRLLQKQMQALVSATPADAAEPSASDPLFHPIRRTRAVKILTIGSRFAFCFMNR
jgi:hypothetical protein